MGGEGLLNEHIAMQRVATVGLPGFGWSFCVCLGKEIRRE